MSLFSFLRKKNQESVGGSDGEFQPRAEAAAGSGRGKRKRGGQDSDAVDPVLPEKKRARRRLVGSIALVLAAIIGLPMILDSEPKPLAEDIAIQIPARDKPATTGAIRPAPSPATAPASAAPVSAPKTAASAVAGLDKGEEIIDPGRKPAAAAPAAVAVKPPVAEAKAVAKSEPKTEAKVAAIKPAAKPEAKPAATPNDPARALAILDGKPEAKPAAKSEPKAADKKPGKYVVQVAALGSQAKVNELQNKLKGAGLQSYTQKVPTESGDRIRVRVGPFGSKEEAEKARAKLVKLGLNGTLVPT